MTGDDRDPLRALEEWRRAAFPEVCFSLASDDCGDFLHLRDFWQPGDRIEQCLDHQAKFGVGNDRRACGAHLMIFYTHQLALSAGIVFLRAGHVARMGDDDLPIRFEARPQRGPSDPSDAMRFHFRFAGGVIERATAAVFHDQIVASLEPVVKAIGTQTLLSRSALWRLAADEIAAAFQSVGCAMGDEPGAISRALDIVKREGSPFFSNELDFETVEAMRDGTLESRTFRVRGGCCLFYRNEGGAVCDTCVLLDKETRRDRLRAHMQRGAP